jgi:diguanylate cyclase (GGDEF)-like protein
MLGSNLKAAELYKHLAVARSGRFESESMTDGVRRLVVYSQISDLPLIIGVGQATQDIYARWREYALSVGLLMLVLCATSAALAIYLAREMQRRNEAESKLALLAMTDSLTGLSNRLQLQQAFDREWRRAARERSPIALVMCDADLFKSYNDQHGHQAGDRLLQAVGSVMNGCIRRATDVAARYGGDEFVVLLPATTADAATRLAEQVTRDLKETCDQMGIPRSHLSIGVASMVPQQGDDPDALLSAADQALYRAKELGRDRIEVAPPQVSRPTLVVENAAA